MDDMNNNPENRSDQPLNEVDELEALRETFQQTYDETMAQEQAEPVIQELDDASKEDPEEAEAENETETEEAKPEKKKKKKKKRSKAPLIILIVLLSLLLLIFGGYFALTFAEPDFAAFMNAYSTGISAEDPAEAVTALKTALGYCTEDSKLLNGFKPMIMEDIVFKTAESSGYAAAKSYYESDFTEDMKANNSQKIAEFLAAADNIDEIADKAYSAVQTALGSKEKADDSVYDAALTALAPSEYLKSDIRKVVVAIADGLTAEKTAKTQDEAAAAISHYITAYQTLVGLSSKGQSLLEIIITKYLDNGIAGTARYVYENVLSDDMKAAPKTEGFASVGEDLKAISGYKGNIFELAKAQADAGKVTEEEIAAAITEKLSDRAKKGLAGIIAQLASGVKKSNEKDISGAIADLQTGLGDAEIFEFDVLEAQKLLIINMFTIGDLNDAHETKATYITDEVLAKCTDEEKSVFDRLDAYYDAYNKAYDVFYSAYSNASYSGTDFDKEAAIKDLNALITDDSTDAQKAYVAFFKYATESCSDANTKDMIKYLLEVKTLIGEDFPASYAEQLLSVYRADSNFEEADKVADELLAIDLNNDLANSVKAFNLRVNNNVKGALELAEACVKRSDNYYYCAYEAAVDAMLQKDWDLAFNYASKLFEQAYSAQTLTISHCELIKAIAALAEFTDAENKTKVDELVETIDALFEQASVTVSESLTALTEKTKTVEDVFLKEPYDFK